MSFIAIPIFDFHTLMTNYIHYTKSITCLHIPDKCTPCEYVRY